MLIEGAVCEIGFLGYVEKVWGGRTPVVDHRRWPNSDAEGPTVIVERYRESYATESGQMRETEKLKLRKWPIIEIERRAVMAEWDRKH